MVGRKNTGTCEECGDENKTKHLGKIRGKLLCVNCRRDIRIKHRKETLDTLSDKDKEELRELSNKANQQYKNAWAKRNRKQEATTEEPEIKGSKKKKKEKSKSYLTFEDKKQLISIGIKRGLNFEEAKESVKAIAKEQARVREEMQEEDKSEEEIKTKQRSMLEELWQY